MRAPALDRGWLQQPFEPINLETLNNKAAMLERLDHKYVLDAAVLMEAAPAFSDTFDMLEIDGLRSFRYETWYFDDTGRRSYLDHHQGRRRRMKVRVRRYVEADLCFVEVKLKDKRGITVKKRMPYAAEKYGCLDESAIAHIRDSYLNLYGEEIEPEFHPVLEVCYERLTLVAKCGGERMTIDSRLSFRTEDDERYVDDDLFILETKSPNGNGIADKVLRQFNQHPVKHCSKYCLGSVVTGSMQKYNKFRPALKRLRSLPGAPTAQLMMA